MKVKIKKLSEGAIIPKYAKKGDAGLDLFATRRWYDEYGNVCYGTGIAMEIPVGFVGLVFPRSSICKKDLSLSNSVGVIDSSYRGEITAKFKPTLACYDYDYSKDCISETYDYITASGCNEKDIPYAEHFEVGERICQIIIVPYPQIEFEEVDELSETERGDGGYGSTGI